MDLAEVRVRPAEAADAAVIAGIHRASRAVAMPFLPPSRRSEEQVVAWVRDVVMARCRVWVAERGGEVLGYAALDGAELDHLYLRPDVLREGIGTLLLAEVLAAAPEGLSLYVFEQNTRARAFYERHGFTVAARGDGSGNMEGLPDLLLRRSPDRP